MIKYKTCDSTGVELIHTCDACQTVELGRIRTLFLIKKGTKITFPLVKDEWEAAIEAGNIIVIPNVKGSSDGGQPIYADGYGDKKERLLGKDYTLSISDPAYENNSDFYEAAEKEDWNIAYCTETLLHYVDDDVTLSATDPIENGTDSEVVWNLELKYRSKHKARKVKKSEIADLLKCFEVTEE